MSSTKWISRWNSWIADTPTKPGVWRRKEGGFLVRGRATDPRTGKQREVRVSLVDCTAERAYAFLQEELQKIKQGQEEVPVQKIRWSEYAASLFEKKVQMGEIKSARTREKWGNVLTNHLVPYFGDFYLDQIRRRDVETWKGMIAPKINAAEFSPNTANDWLATLRVVTNSAVEEFELPKNPMTGVRDFDTSTHYTYTEEEPNSLLPDEVPEFLSEARKRFPQHFAFIAVGFATGLRPSSLRPLRRKGDTPDVLWEKGVLLIRRSQTVGDEVMDTTKTKVHQRINLPEELMDILQWHVDQLPAGPMRESDLLFPSDVGGFRSCSCLDKPLREIAAACKLTKYLTPRGMRRTFQDLCRAAEVKDVVTRSVSGHLTKTMQDHYSTVNAQEQKQSIARVISLAGFKEAMAGAASQGSDAGGVHEAENGSEIAPSGVHGGVHAVGEG